MSRPFPRHVCATLMLGMVSQLAQVVLLRELLMVFQGNELSIGIILSAWLAWTGVGGWLGGRLTQRATRPGLLLALNAGCLIPILPATIIVIRNLRVFFDVLPGASLGLGEMFLSCFLVMAPACLLLGGQFVLLARIWRERDRALDASGASKTYMVEAAGNTLAGVLFTFVLVRLLNAFQITALAAMLMATVALGLYGVDRPGAGRRPSGLSSGLSGGLAGRLAGPNAALAPVLFAPVLATLIITLMVIGLLTGLYFALDHVDRWTATAQWRHFAPDHELVETRPSRHGAIAVLRRDDQYSFFQSGHLVFSTAGQDTAVPGLEEQEAVAVAHLALVQHPDPGRVLLIGGGMRGMLAEILRHPVRELDYIELDNVLTETARQYAPARTFAALERPGIRMIHTDSRLFVKSGAALPYDMIIVDAPDPATAVLNRTYTQEFFQQAQDLLAPGGVLAVGVTSTPDLRGLAVSNRNTAIHHTLADVFGHVLAVGERHLLFFATDDPDRISANPELLRSRFDQREITAQGFSGLHYHVLLHEPTLRRINWILRHHGRAPQAHLDGPPAPPLTPEPLEAQIQAVATLPPVAERFFINSDFRPIAYFYTLMYWNELTRSGSRDALKPILHIRPWWIAPALLVPVLTVLALSRWRARKSSQMHSQAPRARSRKPSPKHSPAGLAWAVNLAALTTGMSTMLMQVALLFAFQGLYGFVYETVGLIVAVFMSGLAVGTFLGQRFLHDTSASRTKPLALGLALVQVGIAALAWAVGLLLPQAAAITSSLTVLILFVALTFIAGLAGGVDFPLAAACSTALTGKPEQAAGRIYGLELAGACLGAALAGVAIAPVQGIPACFLLAGALNAAAGLTLLAALADGSGHAREPSVTADQP
ncbi:spermine synthase [Desulfonatronum sp. SC1]|uniref:spermine/spermidine synthase domain-containing protein n=1 Tax=Desulfonatronum sp. SC1 TaxID=2109626 RepID=UPI000D30F5DA|nr:spermine synthase [Desulfonatronum sp. SC1]PTN34934.1 spermine synthase [Desulfonatronum sp. SC1]